MGNSGAYFLGYLLRGDLRLRCLKITNLILTLVVPVFAWASRLSTRSGRSQRRWRGAVRWRCGMIITYSPLLLTSGLGTRKSVLLLCRSRYALGAGFALLSQVKMLIGCLILQRWFRFSDLLSKKAAADEERAQAKEAAAKVGSTSRWRLQLHRRVCQVVACRMPEQG